MSEKPEVTLTTPTPGKYSRVASTGSYVPERVVTNHEICERIESDDEWIQSRTGIITRHFAAKGEEAVDLAEAASRRALDKLGWSGDEIDVVLVATVTHPYQTPSAATLVATRLGTGGAMAIDLSAACSGFCHAVGLADSMIRSGTATNVLVVGVEKLSDFIDFDDRGSAFIFGDGAGAIIMTPSDTPAVGPTIWGSDANDWDAITQEPNWVEAREAYDTTGSVPAWPTIHMKGRKVFRWAVWEMAPVARKTIEASGITPMELDVFVPHQANMRIIDAMLKELDLPEHVKVARHIDKFGNTSAASVPLSLDQMVQEGTAKSGDVALLIGFGAGLSYAAQTIIVP